VTVGSPALEKVAADLRAAIAEQEDGRSEIGRYHHSFAARFMARYHCFERFENSEIEASFTLDFLERAPSTPRSLDFWANFEGRFLSI